MLQTRDEDLRSFFFTYFFSYFYSCFMIDMYKNMRVIQLFEIYVLRNYL